MQGRPLKVLAYKLNEHNRPCQPYFMTLKDDLKVLQSFVGGYIQIVHLTDEIDLVCSDEGKLIHLPPNRVWLSKGTDNVLDLLVGNFFLCRHKGAELDDIREEDLGIVEEVLKPVYRVQNSTILLLPQELTPLFNPSKDTLSELYPKDTLLYLNEGIDDPYSPKDAGSIAKVQYIDDALNIHVSWLGQRGSISVIYGKDLFFKLPDDFLSE